MIAGLEQPVPYGVSDVCMLRQIGLFVEDHDIRCGGDYRPGTWQQVDIAFALYVVAALRLRNTHPVALISTRYPPGTFAVPEHLLPVRA